MVEIKQQFKLTQQQVMTPQLQQAIRLLQMSRAELVDVVHEEMLSNPILEDMGEGGDGEEERGTPAQVDGADVASSGESNAELADANKKDTGDQVDWERYLENHAMQAPMPGHRVDADDTPALETLGQQREGLTEHLMWQLRMSDLIEEEQKFAMLVIGNLNDQGYLKAEEGDAAHVLERWAAEVGLEFEDAEEVLKIIQRFDPVGVAARDLKECLRIQAEHYGMDALVLRVIDQYLVQLERKQYAVIQKEMGISQEEVLDIAQAIGELEPRPARNYSGDEPQYIVPDVYVHKVGEKYFVVSNDDGLPKLRISRFYRDALRGDEQAKKYVQNKLRSAQWLIRSLDQRRKTIIRVTECIVERQREFFDKGVEFLKPMVLRDVADIVGLHESTVSRVTNKFVHTPRGLFELKYFFNSSIRRDNNQDAIASESVKQAIKQLISQEEPANPLSDQRLVEALQAQGIMIARRTVAKYREMLGVLSAAQRKRLF